MRDRLLQAFDWLFRDRTGKVVIAQLPNIPLALFLAASLLDRALDPSGTAGTALQVVATASLLWWAGDEVLRGVNPFRRLLGGAVALATVIGLVLR